MDELLPFSKCQGKLRFMNTENKMSEERLGHTLGKLDRKMSKVRDDVFNDILS